MGNCSLRAVADATQEPDSEGAVRIGASSTLNTFRTRAAAAAAKGKKTPPPAGNGVWKVKLVINPKDLEKILSDEVNAEALIQQMRIAANSTPIRG